MLGGLWPSLRRNAARRNKKIYGPGRRWWNCWRHRTMPCRMVELAMVRTSVGGRDQSVSGSYFLGPEAFGYGGAAWGLLQDCLGAAGEPVGLLECRGGAGRTA